MPSSSESQPLEIPGPLEIVDLQAFAVRFPYDEAERATAQPAAKPYKVGGGRFTIYPTQVETLMVRLESADGTVGWGEALVPVGHRAVRGLVEELLTPAVIGQGAGQLGALHARLVATMRERGHVYGHQADAVTAVDIAVYDLVGRHFGVPVATLLGGAVSRQLPTYSTSISGGADNGDHALGLWEQGWRRFKVHATLGWRDAVSAFERVRTAVPEAEVALDVHGTFTVADAIRAGRVLDQLDCWFLESALDPEDYRGMAQISAAISTPVAAGEAIRHRSEVMTAIELGAVRRLQPDIGRTGLTEGRAIVTLADTVRLPVLPHHSAALGVAMVAGLHVAAAAPTLEAFEFSERAATLSSVLLTEPLAYEVGTMPLPTGPGLGVEVDEDAVRYWSR
ncbi:mandelate racemase/muconate lactonizing enzyme family protein [Propionibacteriaceae bacterium Y2011]|uniref:mandelate racemase/muconate lactonizing enzyme family protein n=1 Tax=Microlunatus sp. Y2014 TaxID=3418488 RepID=UPI003B44B911